MTLVITSPLTGDPFGPGFQLTATSTFVGPLEPGSFWRITLTAPANEEVVLEMIVPTDINALSTLVVRGEITAPQIVEGRTNWVTGDGAQLQVDLEEPTGGVVDSDTVQVVLDRQTGQNAELVAWLQQNLLGVGEGLTSEEHDAVLQTNVGVIAMAGFPASDLIGAVGSAIKSSPPFGWGSLSGAYTITGDGELPDLDVLQDRYGVYWVATVLPAGLGHVHGNTEEYLQRIVQWRTTHIVGGSEMVTELADFNWHGGLWRFSGTRPHRVEYSILPGVTLEARWWQFP